MKILLSLASLFIMTISVSFSQTASTETVKVDGKAQCATLKECAKKMGMTEAECKKVCALSGDMTLEECAEKMGMTVAECKAKCLKAGDANASTNNETQVAAAAVSSELTKVDLSKVEKAEVTKPACDKSKKACCKKKS